MATTTAATKRKQRTTAKNGVSAKTTNGKGAKATTKSTTKSEKIVLPRIKTARIKIKICGITGLICHRFSDKSRTQIEEKQGKKAQQAKSARNPQQEYEDAFYKLPGKKGFFFPAGGLKGAVTEATTFADGVTKKFVRGAFHILDDYVEIKKAKPQMRTDIVRIGPYKTATPRYRPMFPAGWEMEFTVRYMTNVISPEQIFNLFNLAGFSIGIGDWRPETDGAFGQFEVA